MAKMSYKHPTSKGGSLLKKLGDFGSHPDHKPGPVPTAGNRVRDMGLVDNFNAPTRGEVNKPGAKYPGSVQSK